MSFRRLPAAAAQRATRLLPEGITDAQVRQAAWVARCVGRGQAAPLRPDDLTALASALARMQDAELVRLQCFEGLDLSQAAYEWNYGRQLLRIRLAEAAARTRYLIPASRGCLRSHR